MSGNNKPNTPNSMPPVQAQIKINYHGEDIFTVEAIPNIPLMFLMLGKAIASVGSRCKIKEQSPIVQVPPGARIVS